jgi:hypothetical protein
LFGVVPASLSLEWGELVEEFDVDSSEEYVWVSVLIELYLIEIAVSVGY